MTNEQEEKPKTVQVHYTIIDGENEYGETMHMKVDSVNDEEQAFKELASLYACDAEDEQDILTELQAEGTAMIGCRAIKEVRVEELVTVTVYLRGGLIQDMQNIPPGIRVRVQDYDIENLTAQEIADETEADTEGNPCIVSLWEKE